MTNKEWLNNLGYLLQANEMRKIVNRAYFELKTHKHKAVNNYISKWLESKHEEVSSD